MENKASLIQDIYSLTPLQEGMLFYHMLDSHSGNYIVQSTFKLNSELDEIKFRQALSLLSAKYDVLRTVILYEKMKAPKQVVFKKKEIDFKVFDYSLYSAEDAEKLAADTVENEMKKGFDLQKDTLIRFMYFKMNGSSGKITYIVHHIMLKNEIINYMSFVIDYIGLKTFLYINLNFHF